MKSMVMVFSLPHGCTTKLLGDFSPTPSFATILLLIELTYSQKVVATAKLLP